MENNSSAEIHEISVPETVARLRETRRRLNLTISQIWDMVREANLGLSETTVRRFFDDKTKLDTKWRKETVDGISAVLWGTSSKNFDPTKVNLYFEEAVAMRAAAEESARQLAETRTQLEHYRELNEWQLQLIDFMKERILFLEGRLEYISPDKPRKEE